MNSISTQIEGKRVAKAMSDGINLHPHAMSYTSKNADHLYEIMCTLINSFMRTLGIMAEVEMGVSFRYGNLGNRSSSCAKNG